MVVKTASVNLNGFGSALLQTRNCELKELKGIVIRYVILI